MANIRIDHEDALDVLRMTDCIINEYDPRLPGTEACLNATEYLKKEYHKWCDGVFETNYDQYPGAFFYLPSVVAAAYIVGGLVGFIPKLFYLAIFIFALGLLFLTTQFILFQNTFDRLFRRYPGKNVYGIIESKDRPKRQIILSAHHDSSYISNFLSGNQKLYAFRLFLPFLFYLYVFVNYLVVFLSTDFNGNSIPYNGASGIIFFVGLFVIVPLFWYNSKKGSPGAGDNLVASVIGIKVAEIIRKRFKALTHTRLIFLSNDGEEIGQRGAQAFIEKNKNLVGECNTYVFNIDSIHTCADLAVLTSDRNGTVSLSNQLADEIVNISNQLGYTVRKKKFPFGGGGTDAGQFAKAGIKTTSLIGISTNLIRDGLVYHTVNDTVANLDPNAIEATINIALNFILNKEKTYDGAA